MTSILVIIERTSHKQFKCSYLKDQEFLLHSACEIYIKFLNIKFLQKEIEPDSLNISEIIDCKRRGYLNV